MPAATCEEVEERSSAVKNALAEFGDVGQQLAHARICALKEVLNEEETEYINTYGAIPPCPVCP